MRTATKRYCNTVASYWYRYRYEWEHIHSSSTSQLGFCRTVVERPIVQHGCTTCLRHCWWTWFRLSPGVTTGQGFPLRFRWFFQGMVVATVEKEIKNNNHRVVVMTGVMRGIVHGETRPPRRRLISVRVPPPNPRSSLRRSSSLDEDDCKKKIVLKIATNIATNEPAMQRRRIRVTAKTELARPDERPAMDGTGTLEHRHLHACEQQHRVIAR